MKKRFSFRQIILTSPLLSDVAMGSAWTESDFSIHLSRVPTEVWISFPTTSVSKKEKKERKKILLCRFIPQAFSLESQKEWLSILDPCLSTSILSSDRRFRAGGSSQWDVPVTKKRQKVQSGIIGYYDRLTPQQKTELGGVHQAGRVTAFTKKYPDRWKQCLPFFQHISSLYQKFGKDHYRRQHTFCSTIHPDLVIPNTVFTTITVNRDWQTHTHTDQGDYGDGLSCLVVLGKDIRGGGLGFPRHGILVPVQPGDLIFMDSHQPHCNTPIQKLSKEGIRLSFVCYIRESLSKFHQKTLSSKGNLFFLDPSQPIPRPKKKIMNVATHQYLERQQE